MSEVLLVLTEARELISDESRWTKFTHARDALGQPVDPRDGSAACWCADGALEKAANGVGDAVWSAGEALSCQAQQLYEEEDYIDVNDNLDHAAVICIFDAAITTEQSKNIGAQP